MGDGAGREGSTIHTHKQRKELNSHDSDHNDRKNDCTFKEKKCQCTYNREMHSIVG